MESAYSHMFFPVAGSVYVDSTSDSAPNSAGTNEFEEDAFMVSSDSSTSKKSQAEESQYVTVISAQAETADNVFSYSSNDFEFIVKQSGVAIWNADDIKFGEILGSGYFGEVYSAKMVNAENKLVEVALKRITKQKFRNKNDVQMFLHEIKIQGQLDHPNILPLWGVSKVDIGEGKGDYFMVMPYMPNGSLNSLIKKRPKAVTPRLGGEILKGVAQGMAYLHALKPQPIVHRDLTSLNILLDNSAKPLISDFGLSRFKPYDETMTGAVGSLAWMSPEVFRAERYGEPADVYSYSIICYEVFAKQLPCTQEESAVFASLVALKDHRPDLSIIPPMPRRDEWITLISECWKPSPSDRPTFLAVLDRLGELGF